MLEPIALPRGAALYAERVEGARSFSAGFWFPIGSRHEASQERGFSHFVEHLLFKGTGSRTALDIARDIDRIGGYINAFTERDLICVHCTVPSARWKLALEVLIDVCFNSTLPPEEVERERDVIVSEILAARDDPEEASHDLFLQALWPGDPLSLPIAGRPEEVQRAGREELFGFYRSHILPERLLVTLAGSPPAAELGEFLAGLLVSANPLGSLPADIPVPAEPRFERACLHVPAELSQIYLYEALPIHPPFLSSDWYVLSVLNGALGESMSSRLFQGLREREGLCYSVYSGFSTGPAEGLWMAQANASSSNFPALVAALDRELDAFAGDRPFDEDEVAESISRLEGGFELSLDDPEFRMKRMARQALHTGIVLDVEETRSRILAVDKAAVDEMTARIFSSGNRARFAYGKLSLKAKNHFLKRPAHP